MEKAPNFKKVNICDYCDHINFDSDTGFCGLFPDDKRITKRAEKSSEHSEPMLRVCDKFERS